MNSLPRLEALRNYCTEHEIENHLSLTYVIGKVANLGLVPETLIKLDAVSDNLPKSAASLLGYSLCNGNCRQSVAYY